MSENNRSDSPTNGGLALDLWMGVFPYEDRALSAEEASAWLWACVETGYIWKLPTNYVLHAAKMIEGGVIGDPKRELDS